MKGRGILAEAQAVFGKGACLANHAVHGKSGCEIE